jgi:hypothetical protein
VALSLRRERFGLGTIEIDKFILGPLVRDGEAEYLRPESEAGGEIVDQKLN